MRLIDADALKGNAYLSDDWNEEEGRYGVWVVSVKDIDDAETVEVN